MMAAIVLVSLGLGAVFFFLAIRRWIGRRAETPGRLPNLQLRAPDGARTDLATLAAGRRTILAFVDSGCSHCRSMVERLAGALAALNEKNEKNEKNEAPSRRCRLLLVVEGELEMLRRLLPAEMESAEAVRLFPDGGALRRSLPGAAIVPHTLLVSEDLRVERSLRGEKSADIVAAELGRFCR
ncbi:MAG: hypothetical protein SF339_13495 [Blastocatellia bacterium]|nr:hypothetical protein [Blastocatellia bacterium]